MIWGVITSLNWAFMCLHTIRCQNVSAAIWSRQIQEQIQVLAPHGPPNDCAWLAGRQAGGDLTAELCDLDNFCLLALLFAVCVRLECFVFWHRGVQYVGVLSNRAPPGWSCQTVVEGGCVDYFFKEGWGDDDPESRSELQQCVLGSSHPE